MTDNEALQVLAVLKAAYPNSYRNMTKEEAAGTVNIWAIQFANVPVEVVVIAVNKLIASSVFPPSIAEVKAKLSNIHWEAVSALRDDTITQRLEQQTGVKKLTAEKRAFYEAVRDATERYRYSGAIEPTVSEIVNKSNNLMLGSGNNA